MCSNNRHHAFSHFCIIHLRPIPRNVYLWSGRPPGLTLAFRLQPYQFVREGSICISHFIGKYCSDMEYMLGQELLICKTFSKVSRFPLPPQCTFKFHFMGNVMKRVSFFFLFFFWPVCINQVWWFTNCRSSYSVTSVNSLGQSSLTPCPQKWNKLIYCSSANRGEHKSLSFG